MGQAPACISDEFLRDNSKGFDLKSQALQTAIDVDSKTYIIGGIDYGSPSTMAVQIHDKSTGEWVTPMELGTRPVLINGFSAVLLNGERILITMRDSTGHGCFWFLEIDTPFIRQQRKNQGTEVVAWSKGVVGGSAEKPIVISGPSGVGKGTLISKLMKEFPSMFGFSVSHTTRNPRQKEQNGVHYHFTERSVMEEEIKNGKFLEFASVHGNLYGTSVEAVEFVADTGKRCVLDIDVQGARSVRASNLEAIFVFVCPPSFEELEKRLRARGTELEEQIQKRLKNAKSELDQRNSPGLFDHILVNDDLENCYAKLKEILGLNGDEKSFHESSHLFDDLPVDHSLTKLEKKKVLINCGSKDHTSKDMLVMDTTSLSGGAPGRTRGVNIYTVDDCSTTTINGHK